MQPNRSDVVITGVGLVTSLGTTAGETRTAWIAGACARRAPLPELKETPLTALEVAALPRFDAGARLGGRRMLKYMSDAAVLGCLAAHEAVQQAGATSRFPAERVGLYAGSGLAAADVAEVHDLISESIDDEGRFSCHLLGERGLPSANPLVSFKILANMPACLISIIEGIKGPNLILTPWEGQTAAALREAWQAVASGEVDCALTGAGDSAAHPATVVYLRQSGLLRADDYPASGAGYVVLERAESALRDGKPILGRIADIQVTSAVESTIQDPLAARMGRTYAAAPAIMLALAALTGDSEVTMRGVDTQTIRFALEPAQ